jgi:hypothetical protein
VNRTMARYLWRVSCTVCSNCEYVQGRVIGETKS